MPHFNFFKISRWTWFLKRDTTRLKLGLALRLISKGLFYIRAMVHANQKAKSCYSRVHKSPPPFFSKILEKPSIVQKEMIPHINGLGFSLIWSKKKIQNGRLKKFKMAASKKPHFPAPPILNIFSWNFHGLVLGLVGLIDAKGIDLAQPVWSWGCPT